MCLYSLPDLPLKPTNSVRRSCVRSPSYSQLAGCNPAILPNHLPANPPPSDSGENHHNKNQRPPVGGDDEAENDKNAQPNGRDKPVGFGGRVYLNWHEASMATSTLRTLRCVSGVSSSDTDGLFAPKTIQAALVELAHDIISRQQLNLSSRVIGFLDR